MSVSAGGYDILTAGWLRRAGAVLLTVCAAMVPLAPAAADSDVEVVIGNMRFEPPAVTIKAGTTVTWVNREKRTNHSVLFEQENNLESDRLFPGETYRRTFDRPGAYPYRCGPHPEMRGLIEVIE
jgi:plastocyanin